MSWVHGVRVSRGLDGTGPTDCVNAARTWFTQQSQQQQLMSARQALPLSLPRSLLPKPGEGGEGGCSGGGGANQKNKKNKTLPES